MAQFVLRAIGSNYRGGAGWPARAAAVPRTAFATITVFAVGLAGTATAGAATTLYVPGTAPSPQKAGTVSLAWMGPSTALFGSTATQIGYPASLYPFEGTMALDPSVAQGAKALNAAIRAIPAGQPIEVIGVSQGDVVLSVEQRSLLANPPANTDITFVRFADPTSPTGILGRNAGLRLPGLTFVSTPETPYNTVVITRQYDGIADWPADQLNILADINAVLGGVYFHNQANYGGDLSKLPASDVTTTTNSLGATTTTYLIPDTGLLPILIPLQSLGVSKQFLNAIEGPLKQIIDSAYTTSWSPIHRALATFGQSALITVVNAVSRVASDIGGALRKLGVFQSGLPAKTAATTTATTTNPQTKRVTAKVVPVHATTSTSKPPAAGGVTGVEKSDKSRPQKSQEHEVHAVRQPTAQTSPHRDISDVPRAQADSHGHGKRR